MKKTLKRTLATLLTVIMLFSALPLAGIDIMTKANALDSSGQCGENLFWTFDSKTGLLTISGDGAMKNYDVIDNYSPLNNPLIKSIVINKGVTSIGDYAFYDCYNVKSIVIPNSVTSIGYHAFNCCGSLTSITIPNSVISIAKSAFEDCNKLTSISVDKNNMYYCSDEYGVLYSKDKTVLIQYPIGNTRESFSIPNGVTTIDNRAFYYSHAFFEPTSLKKIEIPDSVIDIETTAFTYCCLTNINVDKNNKYYCSDEYGVLYNKDKTELIQYPRCNAEQSFNIPNSVKLIDLYAFYYCNNLTNVIMDESIEYIFANAFADCKKLTSIIIPNSITHIDSCVFSGCINLTSLTIPVSVEYIEWQAFSYCDCLKDVYYLGTEDQWKNIEIRSENDDLLNANIHFLGTTSYTVTYNGNGGSVSPTSVIVESGKSVTLPTPNTRTGYTCLGWSTSSSATSATYSCGASYKPTANVTLYAVWKQNPIKYTVTFNGNGGTVSPTSATVESGKSVTLPTPTRSGYTCLGWSTSKTATSATYSCGASYKPTSNKTLYAVWKNVTQGFSQNNRFNFSNSSSNFVTSWSGGNYYMTQSDYNKLISYIKKYDSSSSSTISNVQNLMYSEWGGSCYGMASAAVLDYQNKIAFNENFGSGAKTMWDVKSPSTDKNIMSAINYYMVSQEIGFVRNSSSCYDKDYYPSSWTPGLKKLVSTAQKGEPFLFCYYWIEGYYSYGHAIVAYNCKTNSDGSFSITAYDNRYPNKDVIIKVNSSYTSCVVNGDEKAEAFEIYNDMSGFDKIDIDGPKNDMNISYSSYNYSGANDEISVVANGDVTVTNANGETISVVNGDISGTMNILSVHMIVSDTEDGEAAPVEFVFEVGHSKTYMFESTDDKMEVSVKTKDIYGSASSENADCIAIGDDGVYVIGNNMEYSTALSSKDNGYDTVILAGAAKRDVSLTYSGNSILINGVNGKDETITIFAHDEMEPEDYEIKEGYNNVKVDSENNKVDIKGSSNNDGRYDISVVKRNKVNSVSISDIEVNYKSSAKIVPQINGDDGAKYTAKYESSNPSVATVDKDGNITTVHKGSTTITCTVTDEYGNTVKDTCAVNVKFQWWQWLIWILLFGFLWY